MKSKEEQKGNSSILPKQYKKIGIEESEIKLFIEDYAHTYMKQTVYNEKDEIMLIAFGIKEVKFNNKYIKVQAIIKEEELKQFEHYFSDMNIICRLKICRQNFKDNIFTRIMYVEGKENIELENYYIYYDDNEKMQNYLITWNDKNNIFKNYYSKEDITNKNIEDNNKTKYMIATQNYNRLEIVSKIQRKILVTTILLFCITFSVLTITLMNSYKKMIELQSTMTFIIENIDNISNDKINELKEKYIKVENDNKKDKKIIKKKKWNSNKKLQLQNEQEKNTNEESGIRNSTEKESKEIETESLIEMSEESSTEDNIEEVIVTYKIYTIKEGDTLNNILLSEYNSISLLNIVCELNKIDNPNDLYIGQKIYLP